MRREAVKSLRFWPLALLGLLLAVAWRAAVGCWRRALLLGVAAHKTTGRKQAGKVVALPGPAGDAVGTGKEQAGKFQPGASGNPAGRPKGSRNRATLLAQELLDGDGEVIVKKAIAMAKLGEPVALRLCIERILPRRANVVELVLPLIRKANDVADACAAVIEAAGAGRLTLAEAREFMQLLDTQRRSIEI